MTEHRMIPLPALPQYDHTEMLAKALAMRDHLARRRSVRDFSDQPVPRQIIQACLECAGQAPSGANKQPWHFEAVGDPELKHKIRLAAEAEERRFYEERAPEAWLQDLAPLGTDAEKPFLEIAPWLIAIFEQKQGPGSGNQRSKHYYTKESVGLATGFLIAALHSVGLATLTHTPSPMGFLQKILARPAMEKAFLLLVVGYPAEGAMVPDIVRKAPGHYINIREQSD